MGHAVWAKNLNSTMKHGFPHFFFFFFLLFFFLNPCSMDLDEADPVKHSWLSS